MERGEGNKENRLYLFNDENILYHNKKWKVWTEKRKIDYICLMMKTYCTILKKLKVGKEKIKIDYIGLMMIYCIIA